MSGKKRAAEDEPEVEVEGESESEGEGDGESWVPAKGFELFELYSVVINEIEGDRIHGQIRSGDTNGGPGHVIYDGDGDEGKIGVPLVLRGPEKPLLAYDEFELLFCLGKAADAPLDPWAPWSFAWGPGFALFDKVLTEEVESEGFGKATITYEAITSAMESFVDVRFLGIGDNNDKYPTHVYGEIIAFHNDSLDTGRLLYRTSKENAHPLKEGGVVQLLRSAIAAPLKKRINIVVDLWACYDGPTSDPVLSSFIADFSVDPNSGEDDRVFKDQIIVSLTWDEPEFFRAVRSGTMTRGGQTIKFDFWKF